MKFKKIITTILASILVIGLVGCGKIEINKGSKNAGKQVDKTLTNEIFSSVITKSVASDVIIKTGKEYRVRYQGGENFLPKIENKNGQLIIKQNGSSKGNPVITITVPKDNNLTQANIKAEEGDISVQNIKVNNAQFNAEEGDVDLANTSVGEGQISSEEGDINLKDSVAKSGVTIKAEQGDVTASGNNFKGYDLTTEEGSISVNGHSYASSTYKKKIHEKNVLKVESEEGDITVK